MGFVLVDRPAPEVAVITLNRPERMNAMAFDVMVPLREALGELGEDNAVRAIVLTGAGRGFCSGADQESAGTPPGVAGVTRPTYALRAMETLEDLVADAAPAAPAGDRRDQRRGDRRRSVSRAGV